MQSWRTARTGGSSGTTCTARGSAQCSRPTGPRHVSPHESIGRWPGLAAGGWRLAAGGWASSTWVSIDLRIGVDRCPSFCSRRFSCISIVSAKTTGIGSCRPIISLWHGGFTAPKRQRLRFRVPRRMLHCMHPRGHVRMYTRDTMVRALGLRPRTCKVPIRDGGAAFRGTVRRPAHHRARSSVSPAAQHAAMATGDTAGRQRRRLDGRARLRACAVHADHLAGRPHCAAWHRHDAVLYCTLAYSVVLSRTLWHRSSVVSVECASHRQSVSQRWSTGVRSGRRRERHQPACPA